LRGWRAKSATPSRSFKGGAVDDHEAAGRRRRD
jgi:hypothetical protein